MAGLIGALLLCTGCSQGQAEYGTERPSFLPGRKRQVWAVAPVVNLSGQKAVDPILQADLVYQQLQQVSGLTVVPVNRTAEVLVSLRLDRVQSEQQAALVCDLLGCDGLIAPTITAYDPYNPPKLGASLQLFNKPPDFARQASLSPRDMARQATPNTNQSTPSGAAIIQVVGMYDAENGSVRSALFRYAQGRHDPGAPMGAREYLVSMDRYCGFVYHVLIAELLDSPKLRRVQ
ncbi:MAG TPA: hypothetical protein VGO18_33590 [Steroidobacteraceae bacterium]|nr:hypothetical protein [Steroidobacteraceae bacterium]